MMSIDECVERDGIKQSIAFAELLFVLKKTSPTRTELTQHTQSSGRLCVHLLIFLTQTATCRKTSENKWRWKQRDGRFHCVCMCECVSHASPTTIHHQYRQRTEKNGKEPTRAHIQPATSSHSTTIMLHLQHHHYFYKLDMLVFMTRW